MNCVDSLKANCAINNRLLFVLFIYEEHIACTAVLADSSTCIAIPLKSKELQTILSLK